MEEWESTNQRTKCELFTYPRDTNSDSDGVMVRMSDKTDFDVRSSQKLGIHVCVKIHDSYVRSTNHTIHDYDLGIQILMSDDIDSNIEIRWIGDEEYCDEEHCNERSKREWWIVMKNADELGIFVRDVIFLIWWNFIVKVIY